MTDQAAEDDRWWVADAACRGQDVDLFFPEREGAGWLDAKKRVAEAKAICADCPVSAECLQWAIDNHENYGIFGGKTSTERRVRNRKAAAKRTDCAWCGRSFTSAGWFYCSRPCRDAGRAAARESLRLAPR